MQTFYTVILCLFRFELSTSTDVDASSSVYPSKEYNQWIDDQSLTLRMSQLQFPNPAATARLSRLMSQCPGTLSCNDEGCRCCKSADGGTCSNYADPDPPPEVKIDGFCPKDGYPNCNGCTNPLTLPDQLHVNLDFNDYRCCMVHYNAWKEQRPVDRFYFREWLKVGDRERCTGELLSTRPTGPYIPYALRPQAWPTTTTTTTTTQRTTTTTVHVHPWLWLDKY